MSDPISALADLFRRFEARIIVLEGWRADAMRQARLVKPSSVPIRERQAVSVNVAAEFIGTSRTRIYEMMKLGHLDGRMLMGKRVVLVQSLLKYVDGAPTYEPKKRRK